MKRMNETYKQVVAEVAASLGVKNKMASPKLLKIVVNMGVNEAVSNKGLVDKAVEQLSIITGQKPVVTLAKKSIATFKLRRGMPIGAKVTLRGARMLDFWEKLVKIVLPRQRDFKGISANGFDGKGNLNLGFREQTIFPDIEYDKVDKVRGVEITIVTSAVNNEQAKMLLEKLGMPFRK
jgi:large subunit ribosomal protein L5